jgi:hypothetical protein
MDNINRTVVNAMSVLTLACRGTVITIAADTIITAHVNADQWVLTSENQLRLKTSLEQSMIVAYVALR